jgi:hypothetical protein
VTYYFQRLNGEAGSRGGGSGGPGPWARGAIGAMIFTAVAAIGAAPPRSNVALAPVGRTVAQDQGAWVVDYRLRLAGPSGVVIAPEEIGVKVDGWVSNSRVASHAMPRWSSLGIAHGPDFSAVGEVIAAADEAHRCREKLIVSVWGEDQCPCRPGSTARVQARPGDGPVASSGAEAGREPGPAGPTAGLPLSIAPGGLVHVRLRLEHQHVLYGDYDPLLAIREVELSLGGTTIRDLVPLDREQYLAQPKATWPEPPEERRDTRHAVSGPDSLHLEAHVPGHHYYRFPDRPVRYGTKMRLRFWYLVAAGTEGEGRARIAQYKDTPTSWRLLNSAGFERCLKTVGRWTKVEYIFTTDAEATTLALDFRIAGDGDIGEMWIDDVSLEPVGCPGHAGP